MIVKIMISTNYLSDIKSLFINSLKLMHVFPFTLFINFSYVSYNY